MAAIQNFPGTGASQHFDNMYAAEHLARGVYYVLVLMIGVTALTHLQVEMELLNTLILIAFGGLVAILLMFRPRGLLDEAVVHGIKRRWRRLIHAAH